MVQGDCRRPWYSYAVRRGVPSSQKRSEKACPSPRRGVSRQSGALSIARSSPGTNGSPCSSSGSIWSAIRWPWQRPQRSAARAGVRRDGFTMVGSAPPLDSSAQRRSGLPLRAACSAPGPWQASQATPSSATLVAKRPLPGSRAGLGATLWQKTQLSFQRVTCRSKSPPPKTGWPTVRPGGLPTGSPEGSENRNAPVMGNQRRSSTCQATGSRQ